MTNQTDVAGQLPPQYRPLYARVEQSHPFDCWAACIAMIAKKSVAQVNELATLAEILPRGPYWISDEAIAKVLIRYGWVGTLYKPSNGLIDELPDLAIVLLNYDEETQLGHHALAYRHRGLPAQKNICVLIDPAPWVPPNDRVRLLRDEDNFSWFIGVSEVQQSDY